MPNYSDDIVSLDPTTELRFFIQRDQQLKSYLTIDNTSQGNVAYKVKTTAPKFYVVKPNQGILDKGQKITIDITLLASNVSTSHIPFEKLLTYFHDRKIKLMTISS